MVIYVDYISIILPIYCNMYSIFVWCHSEWGCALFTNITYSQFLQITYDFILEIMLKLMAIQ